jgi:hypothetical protein
VVVSKQHRLSKASFIQRVLLVCIDSLVVKYPIRLNPQENYGKVSKITIHSPIVHALAYLGLPKTKYNGDNFLAGQLSMNVLFRFKVLLDEMQKRWV